MCVSCVYVCVIHAYVSVCVCVFLYVCVFLHDCTLAYARLFVCALTLCAHLCTGGLCDERGAGPGQPVCAVRGLDPLGVSITAVAWGTPRLPATAMLQCCLPRFTGRGSGLLPSHTVAATAPSSSSSWPARERLGGRTAREQEWTKHNKRIEENISQLPCSGL